MARRWFGAGAALAALVLGGGCCHWCERHCPQQTAACQPQCVPCCAPAPCCPAPAAAPAPIPVPVAPARSFSNPTGYCVPCTPCQ
jgi:hypothetical protein